MIQNNLTQEKLKQELLYVPETGKFIRLKAVSQMKRGDIAGWISKNGYIGINVCGKKYTGHRLAWLYMTGSWPKQIDHINRIRSDNRWENLREVTQSQNNRNMGIRKDNTSRYKGVYWHKPTGNWLVLGFIDGVQHCLGYFTDWFDAICCRKSWENENPI